MMAATGSVRGSTQIELRFPLDNRKDQYFLFIAIVRELGLMRT